MIADLLGSYLPYQAVLRLPGPVPLLAELTWGRMVQVCVNTMGVGDGDQIGASLAPSRQAWPGCGHQPAPGGPRRK